MKRFGSGLLILALSVVMSAQATTAAAPKAKKKVKAATTTTADDIRELKQMMQQQQSQIQQLQQQIQERDAAVQQLQQQVQQTQSQAQQQASQAESSSAQKTDVDQLKSDMKDVQTTLTNTAVQAQDEQKHVAGIEGVVNRFRWNGDVRVRYEGFSSQDNALCAVGSCVDRNRARIRVRLGLTGKLSEDFIAGLAVATGAQTDPTTTNETLTNVFERKNFYLDRGYITYQPLNHKWLSLTGGKWAYAWTRTSVTFDPDLNPEGFDEKLSWDFHGPVFKNFNVQAMQLSFNEVSKGTDSWASGMQVGGKMQFGFWTTTPAYTILNWYGENAITQNAFGQAAPPFAPNGMTNTTFACGGKVCFSSGFFYSDFIWNNTFKTWSDRFPLYIIPEYEQNLNAAPSQLAGTVGPCHGNLCFSPQDKAYAVEIGMGRQQDQGDWQFGYEWRRQEADSVISSFNESDQRAPTNTLQNRFYVNYKFRKNTQFMFTDWIGRTLNTGLVGAAKASGVVAGTQEPYLNRVQVDVVYTF
jgi:hypothetical protein